MEEGSFSKVEGDEMISKRTTRNNIKLSKTTMMTLRNLARKGTDMEIQNFIEDVAKEYIAAVRDTDYVDEEDYLKIKDTNFECECPNCGTVLSLDLKELVK